MSEDRVVVAMSGGVDSSVAAAFLIEKGYEVIGVTIKRWSESFDRDSWKDIEDARRVAEKLKIPHHVLSLDAQFERKVVDYFVSEYLKGRTPNPCALCNPNIKFGDLFLFAERMNAKYICTGHYAIISSRDGMPVLRRGKERAKDQSYFLARLKRESLSRIIFPVGSFPKSKIRKLAERFGLHISDKKESQEVCFVPDGKVAEFVKRYSGSKILPGPIVDMDGNVIGTHDGIVGYTIGQRKGLGVSSDRPLYIIKIDCSTNTIYVGNKEDLYNKRFIAKNPNWIGFDGGMEAFRAVVKIRYQHRAAAARIRVVDSSQLDIQFEKKQRAITPGQLAVFYDGDVVLGSAWIDRVINEKNEKEKQ